MQEFDFAIVGAGIAGVSLAYHLAPQAKVIILEREHVPAYHTTGRSAALHSETYGSAEIRAITVAAGHFYRKPPDGFTDGENQFVCFGGRVCAGLALAHPGRHVLQFEHTLVSLRSAVGHQHFQRALSRRRLEISLDRSRDLPRRAVLPDGEHHILDDVFGEVLRAHITVRDAKHRGRIGAEELLVCGVVIVPQPVDEHAVVRTIIRCRLRNEPRHNQTILHTRLGVVIIFFCTQIRQMWQRRSRVVL